MSGYLSVPETVITEPLLPNSPHLNPVKSLAVHARQLALKPCLQILRRHRQSSLLCFGERRSVKSGAQCLSIGENSLVSSDHRPLVLTPAR